MPRPRKYDAQTMRAVILEHRAITPAAAAELGGSLTSVRQAARRYQIRSPEESRAANAFNASIPDLAIALALKEAAGHKPQAADTLGVSRSWLYLRLRTHPHIIQQAGLPPFIRVTDEAIVQAYRLIGRHPVLVARQVGLSDSGLAARLKNPALRRATDQAAEQGIQAK